MRKCICCNRRSKALMGPTCAAFKCKDKGVFCPHDGTRLKLLFNDLLKCDTCGCGWTGCPETAILQSSFTCEYVLNARAVPVA